MAILCYGAINPDIVHEVERIPRSGDDIRSSEWTLTWGGKAANAAVALATWEIETRLTGLVIGTDPLGEALLSTLDRPHLDTSMMEQDPAEPTRHCVVLVTPDGARTIVCTGYAGARWTTITPSTWEGIDGVLLDGFSGPAGQEVAAQARGRGLACVWIDAPPESASLGDMVIWSHHEHTADETERTSIVSGSTMVLTRGADPVLVFAGGDVSEFAPPKVTVEDTTGVGDVFAAGCIRGIVAGMSLADTVRWAAAAGAAAAERSRDQIPSSVEIERLVVRR